MKARNFIWVFLFSAQFLFAQSYNATQDSLLVELNHAKGEERVEILHQLILSLWLNYPGLAMEYGQEALEISRELNDSVSISASLRLIAGVYYYKGDFNASLDHNLQALDIALQVNDSSLINNCFNNIGLLYYNLGSYQTALEYLLRSKKYKEAIGEIYGLSTTLNNIGLVYEKINHYEMARYYFYDALSISRSSENKDNEIYSLNNIGKTYLKEGDLDTAKEYFMKGLELALKINNINWGSASLRGFGEVLFKEKKLDSAEFYYWHSLQESRKIEDKNGLAEVFYLLAQLKLSQQSFKESIRYLDSANYYAEMLQSRQHLLSNLKLYADIYKKLGNEKQAITYQNRYIYLRDSLFNDVVVRNLDLIPIKIKQEEDRIQLTNQQAEIKKREFQNRVYSIIIIISIPLLILFFILFRKLRSFNRKLLAYNDEILEQKEKITLQKEEIQQQNKKLVDSLEQLKRTQSLLIESEKLASIGQLVAGLAHELNNPLNYIGGIIKPMEMNMQEIKQKFNGNKPDEAIQEMELLLNGVKEGASRATGIIEKLITISPKSSTQDLECFDLIECITKTVELVKDSYPQSKIIFVNDIPQLEIRSNYYELNKIIFNILINGVEAVEQKANGEIIVSLNPKDDSVEIIINDNGDGIPEHIKKRIFEPFFSTKMVKESSGLGLFVAHTLAQRLKGVIEVKSQKDAGSTFVVSIPLC